MLDISPDIARWLESGVTRIAAVLLVDLQGSGVRLPGALFAVADDGRIAGSVSGGCIEPQLIEEAQALLAETEPRLRLVRYDQSGGKLFSPLQPCSDLVELAVFLLDPAAYSEAVRAGEQNRTVRFCVGLDGPHAGRQWTEEVAEAPEADAGRTALPASEAARASIFDRDDGRCFGYLITPRPRLVIVGASHLGQELADGAMQVGFRVSVVDSRPRFLTEERFPAVAERLVTTPRKAFEALGVDTQTAVCAISHDDKLDDAAITLALERGCYYVGALGSRLTHAERCERLQEQGVAPERLEEIRSPIGIAIGATTPAEIALSIAAEVSGAYRVLVPKRR